MQPSGKPLQRALLPTTRNVSPSAFCHESPRCRMTEQVVLCGLLSNLSICADVDEQAKKEIKDLLIAFDRTLLVADPRRCEPKKCAFVYVQACCIDDGQPGLALHVTIISVLTESISPAGLVVPVQEHASRSRIGRDSNPVTFPSSNHIPASSSYTPDALHVHNGCHNATHELRAR